MSYILDALRRAESQRALGKVPGLGAASAAPASSSSPIANERAMPVAVWIAAVAAFTVLCAWFVWQFLWPSTTNAPTASVPVTVALPPPAVAVPSPPSGPPVDVQAALAPPRQSTAPRFGTADAAPTARVPAASETVSPPTVVAAPAPPASASASAPAAATRVVGLNDLPPDVRQQLPALALSGSVYSETPSARLLVANGQLAREGDTVAPGVTLQQIQPRGAVVLFRGYRVLLPF